MNFNPPIEGRFSKCEEIAIKSDYPSLWMQFGLVESGMKFDPTSIGIGDFKHVKRGGDGWFRLPKSLFSRFDGTFSIEVAGSEYPITFTDRIIRLDIVSINQSPEGEERIPGDSYVHISKPSPIVNVMPRHIAHRVENNPGEASIKKYEDIIYLSTLPEQHIRFDRGTDEQYDTEFQVTYRTLENHSLEQVVLIGAGALFGVGVSALLEAFLASGLLRVQRSTPKVVNDEKKEDGE